MSKPQDQATYDDDEADFLEDEGQGLAMLAIADRPLPLSEEHLSSVTKLGGSATFARLALEGKAPAPAAGTTKKKSVPGAVPVPAVKKYFDEKTRCGCCGKPMSQLAQCYAPLRDGRDRMVHVFCCNSRCSADAAAYVCLTVEIDGEDEEALAAQEEAADNDVTELTLLVPRGDLPPRTLPPYGLYVEEEPVKEDIDQTDLEKEMQRMAEVNDGTKAIPAEDVAALEREINTKNTTDDVAYELFRQRLARCSRQALRYHPGGKPVFMQATTEHRAVATVQPCPRCNATSSSTTSDEKEKADASDVTKRPLELQVMPTALYFMKTDQYVDPMTLAVAPGGKDEGVDFGTVSVFACSCAPTNEIAPGVWAEEEFVFLETAPQEEAAPPAADGDTQQGEKKMSLKDMLMAAAKDGQ